MKPPVILGAAGTIGRAIAWDWVQSTARHKVILVDRDLAALAFTARRLGPRCIPMAADLRDAPKLAGILRLGGMVINSTSHHFNLPVMEAALAAGCHYLDLGGLFHFTRRQMKLHRRFSGAGLTAVIGMGCAPGLTNLMARELTTDWDRVRHIDIRVAGVDHNPSPEPGAFPYAFRTLLEELTLKPAVFEKGKWNFVPPRTGNEHHTFPPPVGTQELFYTLHSEIATLPLYFRDRGIRRVTFRIGLDPALCEQVLAAKTPPPFMIRNQQPLDEEMALVEASGTRSGKRIHATMVCLARSRGDWSAGDLDTACPASAVASLILNQTIQAPGVHPPEDTVPWNPLQRALKKRGFVFGKTEEAGT